VVKPEEAAVKEGPENERDDEVIQEDASPSSRPRKKGRKVGPASPSIFQEKPKS
jgi:hypothetical protein